MREVELILQRTRNSKFYYSNDVIDVHELPGIVFKGYCLAFFIHLENTFLMATNDNLIEVLNDLIRINNDRIVGYQRASQEARDIDVDLRSIFTRMGEESKQYAAELTQEVVKLGGEPATGTTASGKIYRVWMDVKATFTGHDRQTVLNNCEFGEDAAQRAYETALGSDAEMNSDVRQLIANQKSSLKTSHDVIKKYRDMHKAVNDTVDDIRDVTNRNLR
jgi:uncharacterized protein (TIGR02284 family)